MMCCVHFTLCCRETMLYWMLGTDLTSEPSHFGNVQFSSQIASHSPISNNTPDWVMRCWGCTSPGSLLSWFIYVKGTTRGEYILTESKFGAKNWGAYFYTPVFRRDVLWYGDVRPSVRPSVRVSVRPSVRPSVTVFRTFLLHALRY